MKSQMILVAVISIVALVSPVLVKASTYSTTIAADTPVAWWRLGESAAATTAVDSANSHDGAVAGGVTFGQAGAIAGDSDTAASFLSGAIIVPDDAALNFGISNDYSMEAWFKLPTTGGSTGAIINKGDTNSSYWMLAWNDGKVGSIMDYGATADLAKSTSDFNDGLWHHLVTVSDRSDSITVYVDTNMVATKDVTAGGDVTSTLDLWIGQLGNAATYFKGSLDEVAIYNYALSTAQIDAHYDAGAIVDVDFDADFDMNGDVDGSDFLSWQRGFDNFAGTADKSDGDATGDGFVNGSDLAVWESQFGSSGNPFGAAIAVPEPTALTLAYAMLFHIASRRKQEGC